jgi:hypothetical protein
LCVKVDDYMLNFAIDMSYMQLLKTLWCGRSTIVRQQSQSSIGSSTTEKTGASTFNGFFKGGFQNSLFGARMFFSNQNHFNRFTR